ncbi:MAG: molybdate ABC transporter substrate-binding protein [Betaproteobacteria bacterium]|nr:molybdate ABC transporter substrate-binding protein [Betaproteobacteria bacterium]
MNYRDMKRWAVILSMSALAPLVGAAEITVSAASSLTNAFTDIGKEFEKAKGHKVLFNFGASGSLLQQISRGAPVDVFATADLETMDRAEKQNAIVKDSRRNFVSNMLVVATPVRGPLVLGALADLTRADVQRIAMGIPESVSAGRYTKAVLEGAKLWEPLQPKMIFAQNVRQCLDYVARGEVDAGFVYATDTALVAGKVRTAFEVHTQMPIVYPIAAVKGSGQENLARAFIDFVRSDGSRRILAKYGFLEP